ncbi:MAG: DUF2846 domain-containing protein [Pyrinomonadaceae bacterium]
MFYKICIAIITVLVVGGFSVRAQEVTLADGTALQISLVKDISSKDAQRGDVVEFSVDEDIVADGQIVIKKGSIAKGSIIYAEKGGYMGKSGKLALQIDSTMTVDGETIQLRAAKGGEGESKTGTVFVMSNIIGPFAMLMKGGDTTVKSGAKLTVYTAEQRKFMLDGTSLTTVKSDKAEETRLGEPATVYIYRPKKMLGGALEPSVYCDGVELARMDNGRYFVLKLAPGKHIIHMTNEKKGYELNMAAGQTYYFRIGIEAGMWKGQGKILLEDNDKGAAEVKKIKPLGADKIMDKTMVVTTEPTKT